MIRNITFIPIISSRFNPVIHLQPHGLLKEDEGHNV